MKNENAGARILGTVFVACLGVLVFVATIAVCTVLLKWAF